MSEKTPEGSPFEAMAKMTAAGMGPMGQFGTLWAEALADMGSEVLHFVSERMREDVATQHKLLHCTTMEELRHIQAEFVQTAIDQYTAETGKAVEMSAEMMRKLGLPPVE